MALDAQRLNLLGADSVSEVRPKVACRLAQRPMVSPTPATPTGRSRFYELDAADQFGWYLQFRMEAAARHCRPASLGSSVRT